MGRWDYYNSKQIIEKLLHCDFHRHCKVIGYNRYQIDGKLQEKLNKISNIKPLSISHSMRKSMMDIINEYPSKFVLNSDGRALEEIRFLYFYDFKDKHILKPDMRMRTKWRSLNYTTNLS